MKQPMHADEFLTRGAAWVALSLYSASEFARSLPRGKTMEIAARGLSTLGCATLLAHIICAFQFYHAWSHTAAYADTARQTAALVGWDWGGGLYVNYLFALVWLGEVAWSWCSPRDYNERPKWVTRLVRGFFLFMIVNGAVIFAQGPMRWLGVCLCWLLAGCWWKNSRSKPWQGGA